MFRHCRISGRIRGLGVVNRLAIVQIHFLLILLVSLGFHSQGFSKSFSNEVLVQPKFFLTFDELRSLKREDRVDYLKQVALYLSERDRGKSAQYHFDWMSFLIREARAHHQYRCVGGGVPVDGEADRCGVSSYAGFSCPNGYEICNPFIFGVRSDRRPFCYQNATTKKCYKSITVGRNSTLDLVYTEENRAAYNEFTQEFEKICSGNYRVMESARNLSSACHMVRRQTQINRRRNLASYRGDLPERDTPVVTSPVVTAPTGACTMRVITNGVRPSFNHRPRNDRKFIEDITPLAVEIQEATGFPASILVAKAILESASGSSSLARRSNNYAGMSCFSGMTGWTTVRLAPPIWSIDHTLRQRCHTNRPASEGGRYRDYNHPFDSILDSVKLMSTGRYFNRLSFLQSRGINRTMADSMSRLKDGHNDSDYRNILTILDRVYAPDQRDCPRCPSSNNEYDKNLLSLINRYDLRSLDSKRPCSATPGVLASGRDEN